MNCPFCNFKLTIAAMANRCMNHNIMVTFSDENIYIADDGYEILLGPNGTHLFKYERFPQELNENTPLSHLYMNGFMYNGLTAIKIISLDYILPITPDNFHQYLDKLLKLKVFS